MKRLKKTVHSKNTTRKKNNGGMTYIELLVALSLLVLVVTVFSPMLLRSYDSLYKAGEMTEFAYDARSKIEEGLSVRENDNFYNIQTNFEKLSDTVSIKARQIVSSVNGLETLYGGARGRIKVISDSVVSDNQSVQVVRLLVTNLDKDKYTFERAASATAAQNPANGEVLFYVCSVFDDSVQLEYDDPVKVEGTNYIDILVKNLDVTKAPIKFLAYYRDDFGAVKKAETYLYVEPADMMLVGDSGTQDYFTSAGVNEKTGAFYIAGRQMTTAPINGEMLNDVEWVGTENDSALSDGYYLMCGENSVVRRLWRMRDSSKSANITYETTAINGNAYFQYDWKGDYMDVTALSDDDGVDIISYGSNSNSNGDFGEGNYMTKNQYRTDSAYYSYYVNGYTSDGNEYKNNNKRISYILEVSEDELASTYGIRPQDGVFIIKGKIVKECNRGKSSIGSSARDRAHVYCAHCNTWFSYGTKLDWFTTVVNDPKSVGYTGLNYKTSFFMYDNGHGNSQISEAQFQIRHCAPDGNGWGSAEYAEVEDDEQLACIVLKAYNTVSPEGLTATSTVDAKSNTSKAIPNLTSCTVLPGNNGDALYLGTMDSSALINTTKGVTGSGYRTTDGSEYSVDVGYGVSYVYIGDGNKTYKKVYDQTKLFGVEECLNNGGKVPVNPNAAYGYDSFRSEYNAGGTYLKSFEEVSDLRFTMGYSSDMYKLFNNLADEDKKPLERYYSASSGVYDNPNDHDSAFRQNLWFPREFLNITESDAYNKSVVAVGYDVGGYSEMYYQYLPEYTTSTNTRYLSGAQDMDWDNNGIVDYFDPDSDKYGTLVAGSTLIPGANTALLQHSFNDGDHRFYFIDPQSGASEGDGTKTVLALPQHITLSTQLNKVTNNGVLSVYNEKEATFTPIYYYKDPNKRSIRFNCVATIGISDTVVGAAVGLSDGRVMLAQIPYVDGKLATTALTNASCTFFDAIPEISSITAIKAFQYDINGDETPENLIVAGGTKVTDKTFVIRINDINTPSKHYKIVLKDAVKVTDFAIVNGYLYISAIQSNGNGIIYTVSLKNLTAINGKDVVTSSGTYITLGDSVLVPTKKYYTEFAVDIDDGTVIGAGTSVDLPVINSIAAKAEQ